MSFWILWLAATAFLFLVPATLVAAIHFCFWLADRVGAAVVFIPAALIFVGLLAIPVATALQRALGN